MKRIVLIDSTGREWTTDWSNGVTPEIEEQIIDLFDDWGELTNLALEVEGAKRYFNPAHIVAAWIEDDGTPASTQGPTR
jgi:hypothetical protein